MSYTSTDFSSAKKTTLITGIACRLAVISQLAKFSTTRSISLDT